MYSKRGARALRLEAGSRMIQKIALASFAALAIGLGSPAVAQQAATTQTAPAQATTARFSSFLSDVLVGRVPGGISETMKSQSSAMLSQIGTAFKPLGTFQSLKFVREDSLQGYRRYHYSAIFEKGSKAVIFVTDSNGTIVGFFEDQPQ